MLVGPEMVTDSRILRFFRGISKLRPSKPKYDSTWDPKIVLKYFTSLPSNEELLIKQLTKKLICLLALITGHRMQTFAQIKTINIKTTIEGAEIKIPDQIKTSGPNKKQPWLTLPYYLQDEKICAASTLRSYSNRTRNMREDSVSLYISFKNPYRDVTTQTLSRWVKYCLQKNGIDTQIFTAHSTRYASTSAANRNGLDLDLTRRTAGWTPNSNTLSKFYNLKLVPAKDLYANAVLILILV